MANEVLFLLDEASALGGLAAIEEALVRGRSGGIRLLLAYQSASQVRDAFKDKPTLIPDNCSVHLQISAPDLDDAKKTSEKLGEWTQVVESGGDNEGRSWQANGDMNQGRSGSSGNSRNWAVQARALLKPDEVLRLGDGYILAFLQGKAPLLARKIRWFSDPAFNPAVKRPVNALWWLLLVAAVAVIGWAFWK